MIVRALQFAVIPVLIVLAAGWFMGAATGLQDARAVRPPSPVKHSLVQRYQGYTADDVTTYWVASDIAPAQREFWREAELRFLRYDLGYPLVYGVCLLWALFGARSALGVAFPEAWIFVAVAVPVVADWVENAILLQQLPAKIGADAGWSPDATWIAIASAATQVKLAGLAVALGLLLVLCGRLAFGR